MAKFWRQIPISPTRHVAFAGGLHTLLTQPANPPKLACQKETNLNRRFIMSTLDPLQILNILWGLRQEIDALENDTRSEVVSGAQVEQNVTSRMVIPLDARLSKLALICRAMWSLMQQHMGVTEEDLLKRITEIDGMDGRIDGRVTKPALQCPKCKSVVCRQFNRCLFCGYEPPDRDPFDEV